MRIGVTGYKGFIGQNLVNEWIKPNPEHELVPFDKNINSANDIGEFFNCDVVVHLAGKNKGTDKEIVETNFFGTKNILDWCVSKKVPIIIAGSDYKQDSAYKFSKKAIKSLCEMYAYRGLNSLVLNLPKVFGPYCKPHYNSFVTTLIDYASMGLLDQYLYLIKNIKEEVELVHVADVCDIIMDHTKPQHFPQGSMDFQFNKYSGLFKITFEEIIDILKGNKEHRHSEDFLSTLEWYKRKNANAESK